MQDDRAAKRARYDRLTLDEGKSHEEAIAIIEGQQQTPVPGQEGGVAPPEKPKAGMGIGVAREAAAGLLPGIATRAEAAVRAIGPETYKGSLGKVLAERKQFQAEHPGMALGANVVGGLPLLLVPGLGAGNVAKAGNMVAKLGQAAKAGAKAGALYGAAESYGEADEGSTVGDFLGKTATGAALGAGGGAALAPVAMGAGAALGKAGSKVADLLKRIRHGQPSDATALGRSSGAQRLLEIVTEARGTTAARPDARVPRDPQERVLDALRRAVSSTTPDDPRVVADLAPEMGGTLRGVRNASPATNRAVQNQMLRARSGKTGTRVLDQMAEAMGLQPEDALALSDDILARRAAQGADDYASAFARGEVSDPDVMAKYAQMRELFPEAEAAGRESQQLAYSRTGREMPQRGGQNAALIQNARDQGFSDDVIARMGLVDDAPNPTVEDLHYFKQGVDRSIKGKMSGATKGTPLAKGDLANAADLQRQFLEALDAAVPEYGAARGRWSDETALEHALQAGREAFHSGKVTSREVRRAMAELGTDAEREMFRVGAFDAAREVANTGGTGDEGLRALFGVKVGTGTVNRPDRLEKMRALFRDEDAFTSFERRLRQEIAGAETAASMGNSQTAEKIAEQARVESSAPGLASGLQGSPTRMVADEVMAVIRDRMKGLRRKDADAMGQILMKSVGGKDATAIFAEMGLERARRQGRLNLSRREAPTLGGIAAGSWAGQGVAGERKP